MRFSTTKIVLAISAVGLMGADWPQWLGPTRDGVTPEKVAPWSEPLKTSWKIEVGEGHSSPIVANGKVFLFYRREKKEALKKFEEVLVAYEAAKGDRLWETPCGDTTSFSSLFGNGPRSTPCLADGKIFTVGVTGILSCLDTAKGKLLWQVDTLKEFKASNLFFGVSGSPIVDEGKVLLQVGGKGAGIVAFDCQTGKVVWKSADQAASYSSGIILGKGTTRQGLFLTLGGLVSINPDTGDFNWTCPFTDKLNESSTTPVHIGDLVIASTITSGALALRINGKDGKPSFKEVWKNPELTCYFSTPVPVGKNQLYMVSGTTNVLKPEADLHCVDPDTGKTRWTRPKVGKYHACLLRTGDDRLLLLEDNGELALLEPHTSAYKELARSKICGETWAHPAVADGRLFVRDAKRLYCVPLKEGK